MGQASPFKPIALVVEDDALQRELMVTLPTMPRDGTEHRPLGNPRPFEPCPIGTHRA